MTPDAPARSSPAVTRPAPLFALPLPLLLLLAAPALAQDPMEPTGPEEEQTVVIQLEVGGRLRGELVREDAESLVLDHPTLGRLTIPVAEVARRLGPDAPLNPKAEEVDPPPPGLFGTSFLKGWEKSVGLGLNGNQGDSQEFGVNASAEGDYEDDDVRWRFRSAYFFGRADGVVSQDEAFANLRRDEKLPGNPLFLFAEGRFNYNDFQAWRYRAGGFGGVGVSIFNAGEKASLYDADDFELLARLGAGASYEWGTVDDAIPEALAAVEGKWRPFEGQTLRFSNTIFPSLDDLGESRNVTEVSYTAELDAGRGLSFKVGLFNEYLSETADDSSHNSLSYYAQLTYAF